MMSFASASAAAAAGPSMLDEVAAFLSGVANRPPSHQLWGMLAGTATTCIKSETNPALCALYLKAVAQQLPASYMTNAAAAMLGNNTSNLEIEMVKAQMLADVLDTVATAASRCSPRQAISQSGILRALLLHPGHSKSPFLTQVQVEFCQVAVLAGQYRLASRFVKDQWPRPGPATGGVKHVLRYFLLRGMIHVGCEDWPMAARCFKTCLSIPAEGVSAVAVSAWKKLVLVQCLQMEDDDYEAAQEYNNNKQQQQQHLQQDPFSLGSSLEWGGSGLGRGQRVGPLALPKAVPDCITRFLAKAAKDNDNDKSNNKQQGALQKQKQENQKQKQENQKQKPTKQQKPQPEDAGVMALGLAGWALQQKKEQKQKQKPAKQPQPEDVGVNLAGWATHPQKQQQKQRKQGYSSMGVKVYMDLVHAFVGGDRDYFLAIQTQHKTLLQKDENLGLVRQCETAMVQRQVYQLSRMFSAVPLTDLAAKLQVDSVDAAKALLLQVSLQKTIHPSPCQATKWPRIDIEDEDGMVVFDFSAAAAAKGTANEVPVEDQSSPSELETNIMQLVKLTQDMETLDVGMATSPMYHAVVRRATGKDHTNSKMGSGGLFGDHSNSKMGGGGLFGVNEFTLFN